MNPAGKKNRSSRACAKPPSPCRERQIRLTAIERRSLLLVVILFLVGMLAQAIRHTQGRTRGRPAARHPAPLTRRHASR